MYHYLHFGKLPQSGVYIIHFPHVSDVLELKGFGLFLNMLFSIDCLSTALEEASLSLSISLSRLGHLTAGQNCQPAFICFSVFHSPPILSSMLHKLFWGGILFLGWMHSCAPYKSQSECEQTCHETACKECTYKKACFIDEPFFKAPPKTLILCVFFICAWLVFTDISRCMQAVDCSVEAQCFTQNHTNKFSLIHFLLSQRTVLQICLNRGSIGLPPLNNWCFLLLYQTWPKSQNIHWLG